MTTDIEWTKGSPEEFKSKLKDPQLVSQPTRNFLERAVVFIQGLAKDRAPRDRGQLWQSITTRVDPSPTPLWGKVGSNVKQALPMEYGTNALSEKPSATGSMPFPTGPQLETWAKRHGFRNGYVVAAIIKRRGGVAPRRYLRGAFAAAKGQIQQFLRQMGKEIEARWGN
jgi:hypothetical protein